jgi:Icc protein
MTTQRDFISILQLTDLHLFADPESTMLGVNTAHYFNAVLNLALASGESFDLLLLTGDLAQEPCQQSYHYIVNTLNALPMPCVCLPGNHDEFELMQQIFNTDQIHCHKQIFLGNWQIISLNSRLASKPEGYLAAQELLFLEQCLRENPAHFSLIAVHHHCLASHSAWMDTMMITNSAALWAIVNRYSQTRVIVHGHVHQVMDDQMDSVRVLGTPSTCFQFQPESLTFSVDTTSPAYRQIRLFADGSVESDVVRLPEKLTHLSTNTAGY